VRVADDDGNQGNRVTPKHRSGPAGMPCSLGTTCSATLRCGWTPLAVETVEPRAVYSTARQIQRLSGDPSSDPIGRDLWTPGTRNRLDSRRIPFWHKTRVASVTDVKRNLDSSPAPGMLQLQGAIIFPPR
jgi:hypothetical protein